MKNSTQYSILNTLYAILIALVLLILPQAECIAATLTITASHGSVTATPQKAQYDYGEVVQLIPKPETGYYFTGWGGDARGKSLVLNLTMDSDKTIIANFGVWRPPIGIPMPEFGIFETYRMYDDPAKRNPTLSYIQNAEGGYYTHYVDNTHASATDTNNPYGTEDTPRLTLAEGRIPAGSIVEFHGGPYSYGGGRIDYAIDGTATMPVFIRGEDANKTDFASAGEITFIGSYLIFEDFHLYDTTIAVRNPRNWDLITDANEYLVFRDCELEGDGVATGADAISLGSYNTNSVVYNCHIHHQGDYDYVEENDSCGTSSGAYTHYIWIVDNHIHHNGGDSYQGGHAQNQTSNHIYIGRNVMHDDGENAVDLKDLTDVVVSQNVMYGYNIIPGGHSDGVATVTHYGPSDPGKRGTIRAWYLFNEMYDAQTANQVSSGPEDTYFIGNIIHDINGPAYIGWSHRNVSFVGNTMYNIDKGIDDTGGTDVMTIANNIFGTLSGAGPHIKLDYSMHIAAAIVSNNLFQDPMNVNTRSDNYIEADPQFIDAGNNDFHLQPTSPAIDTATSSGAVQEAFDRFQALYGIDIRKDFEGRPRIEPWDIGAYEYASSASIPGDVNADSEISAFDAALAAHIAVDLEHAEIKNKAAAEVSGDGEVTAYDAALIAQRAVGLIERFPVEG